MPKLRKTHKRTRVKKVKPHTQKYWKNQLDPLMSKLIRSKLQCEKCGVRGEITAFDDAHIVGRKNLMLRWDIFNHLCLCFQCHRYFWHEEPLDSGKWFEEKFPARYEYLLKVKNLKASRTEEDYINLREWLRNKQVDKLHLTIEQLNSI